ncbi:MAG: GNAT family N-acetyltransferase [Proteobacteria bacterium]|nr:GNAT family N-acetyltransferase [Pseudomonadota bacterium]MDA0993901.1 GNAT family N-acetyltransferase [Pseudomonadota bacterium]
MRIEVANKLSDFSAAEWNRLVGNQFPFLRYEFLYAAESSGSASAETGWIPRHLGLRDKAGKLQAAMPLYEKRHSWGEFVFDWSWAQAYEKAGLAYYPKLVSAIPFTPAPSTRLLASEEQHKAELVDAAGKFAADEGFSSLHVLFPEESELQYLRDGGLQVRKDCQFHWHNRQYVSFDDFLRTFSSAKRKKACRDRRRVREQGITFRRFKGHETDAALWNDVYELISITFLRRGGMPYFSYDFFIEVSKRLPDNILVIVAEKDRTPVAAAVFFDTENTLYGRYWGADDHYDALHFETCYYQGIEYCIEHKRRIFEPGTQGEHKISRGFVPVTTWSAHWLARPEFFSAVESYLRLEARHIEQYIDAVNSHSPYKIQPVSGSDH